MVLHFVFHGSSSTRATGKYRMKNSQISDEPHRIVQRYAVDMVISRR